MPSGPTKLWSVDHLRIACAFYFTLPFGRMHKSNPDIIHLAGLLGRTPSSLAMKLTQFASLDPEHQARGVSGFSNTSQADRQVWQEFQSNWTDSITAGHSARLALEAPPPTKPTEDLRLTKTRLEQTTFRNLILAAYNNRCCITGNPVPELLVASHILPWATHPDHRLNPRNGLCLSAEFDRAFDRHLISIDSDYCLVLSPTLRRLAKDDYVASHFINREGTSLAFPERFMPAPEFLAEHRAQLRRKASTINNQDERR